MSKKKLLLLLLVLQSRIFLVCGLLLVRIFFKSRYVSRNICTESAVPEEATQQGKVSGEESNGVFFVTLGALIPCSLRRISPSRSA